MICSSLVSTTLKDDQRDLALGLGLMFSCQARSASGLAKGLMFHGCGSTSPSAIAASSQLNEHFGVLAQIEIPLRMRIRAAFGSNNVQASTILTKDQG
jgi:hypothetical protein